MKPLNQLLCAAILSSLGLSGYANSQTTTAALQSQSSLSLISAVEDEMSVSNIYRAYYPSKTLARKASISFHGQIHAHNREEGYLIIELSEENIAQLTSFGFRITPAKQFIEARNQRLDNIRTQALNMAQSQDMQSQSLLAIPGYPCYETVEETFAAAENITQTHPNLADFIDVGNSWQKTQGQGGYDIKVLKLTNKSMGGSKPILFINSAIHAREYTTAPLTLAFANWLIDGYDSDADATWLLDHHEVHLMLHTNPDGRKRAETGLSWRKNTNQNYCGPTSNTRGADLNRNFTASWNVTNGRGSSGNQCSLTYRGPSPASEPETQAIENYVRSIFPDSRGPGRNDAAPSNTSGIHLDIHSFSELVLWPWGDTSSSAPNGTALQTLGRKFAFFNGYEPTQSIGLYPTDGTSDAISYDELGVAAFTFELGTAFFQSCSVFENTIKPDNLPALIYAAKVVRTPYLTPAGPDITTVRLSGSASGSGVPAGTSVTVSGGASDARFNNSNGTEPTQSIAGVEYYLDVPPWENGANAIAMSPSDGSFNQVSENFTGSIDTRSLSEGRHMVYVRARDASGRWGAVSAQFLVIADGPTPTSTPIPTPTPTPNPDCINLESTTPFTSVNSGSFSASGCTMSLLGNIWRASNQTFSITSQSVLSFDFSSNQSGEIHGIGFDEDSTASTNRIFQLSGTQNWGIRDYSYSGGTQSFSIPVGQYYTGTNLRLILVNDKDSGSGNNTSTISNVRLTN